MNIFSTRGKSCNNIHVEEVKERFMAYEEVALWLTEKPHRQCISNGCSCIGAHLSYYKTDANKEANDVLIREDKGEWHKPLIKVKDY